MLYFVISFLIVLADQASKSFTAQKIGVGGQFELIPGIVRLTHIQNTGGAFSIFSDKTLILTIISAVAVVIILLLLILSKFNGFGRLSLAFILGGAIGNLIDRIVYGFVVDMIEPTFITFAVFNVADIFVCVGAFFLVIYLLFFWHPGKNKAKNVAMQEMQDGSPAPYSPIDHKPRNARERRVVRRAKKFGPDVDESTVKIPVKDVRAAAKAPYQEPEILPDVNDVYDRLTRTTADDSDFASSLSAFDTGSTASSGDSDELDYTLDDILKEYGYDD